MPNYDWRCPAGHEHEAYAERSTHSLPCPVCNRQAQRQLAVAGIMGMVTTPTRYAPIPLTRFVEAQHEMVYQAEKQHVSLPDPLQIARQRVARGDVKAIE